MNVPDRQDSRHDLDALHRFTSGRWLWGERQQFAARYVTFNLSGLLSVAATAVGSNSCAQILKISEGQYNKVFLLTMNDGQKVIAKLPNPNAGRRHFTTASEVATMDFLRNVLHIPVPKVYAWNSRSSANPVGAEYIITEKQSGIILDDVWKDLCPGDKGQIIKQIVAINATLGSTKFTKLGALYYKNDLPSAYEDMPLYVDRAGSKVHSSKFSIGPTNHRSFFDFGKGELDIDRGPWSTCAEYLVAIAHKEIVCVNASLRYPLTPEGLFYGPRQYQPSAATKLCALQNYLKVASSVLPENKETHSSVLWHGDLHSQNIFVDQKDPARILGIIDWQSASACPLFMQITRPGFLDYNGPVPSELGVVPFPPDFDTMTPDQQREARALHEAQTLHNIYQLCTSVKNPAAFTAMQNQESVRHQASVLPGLTLTDSEPCLNGLLREVKEDWPEIVGIGSDGTPLEPCPLQFSSTEVEQQERDEALWAQGVDLMDEFLRETGGFKHWDGRVSNENYEHLKKQWVEGVEEFLKREAKTKEERMAWLKVLPFVD